MQDNSLKDAFTRAVAAWEGKGSAAHFADVVRTGRDALGLDDTALGARLTVAPERIGAWLEKKDVPHPHIRGMVVTALKKLVG